MLDAVRKTQVRSRSGGKSVASMAMMVQVDEASLLGPAEYYNDHYDVVDGTLVLADEHAVMVTEKARTLSTKKTLKVELVWSVHISSLQHISARDKHVVLGVDGKQDIRVACLDALDAQRISVVLDGVADAPLLEPWPVEVVDDHLAPGAGAAGRGEAAWAGLRRGGAAE